MQRRRMSRPIWWRQVIRLRPHPQQAANQKSQSHQTRVREKNQSATQHRTNAVPSIPRLIGGFIYKIFGRRRRKV